MAAPSSSRDLNWLLATWRLCEKNNERRPALCALLPAPAKRWQSIRPRVLQRESSQSQACGHTCNTTNAMAPGRGEDEEESSDDGSYCSGSSSSDEEDLPPPPPESEPATDDVLQDGNADDNGDIEKGVANGEKDDALVSAVPSPIAGDDVDKDAAEYESVDENSIEIPGEHVKKTKTLKRIDRQERQAARKEMIRNNKNFICCIVIMMILVIIAAILASVLIRDSESSSGGNGGIQDNFPGAATADSSGTDEDNF